MPGTVPGEFRSPLVRAREDTESVRVTVPEGVARILGAVPGGTLVWSVDLKGGCVTVSAEPPESSGRRSSKRD